MKTRDAVVPALASSTTKAFVGAARYGTAKKCACPKPCRMIILKKIKKQWLTFHSRGDPLIRLID